MDKQKIKDSFEKKRSCFFSFLSWLSYFFFNQLTVWKYISFKIRNKHHLPSHPFIICSNHSSHSDSVALMLASGDCFGRFYLLAAQDYWYRETFPCWLARNVFCMIPVSRQVKNKNSFSFEDTAQVMERLVSQKKSFVIYPEGGRSSVEDKGAIRPFKAGAARFSMTLGIPILPVFIGGATEAMGKGRFFPRFRSRYEIYFGEPVSPQMFDKSKEMILEVEQRVRTLQKEYLSSC